MNDLAFIDLALRYLDSTASRAEVVRLEAEMLDAPSRRALYRDLVRHSQLAHEWQPRHERERRAPRRRITRLALAASAAAAILLASLLIGHSFDSAPLGSQAPAAKESTDPFGGPIPNWSDIYRSIFDYPEFVWRSEISHGSDDDSLFDIFSEGGALVPIAAAPTAEFNRLLEPIILMPIADAGGDYFF